jgi:hypothetical protein
MPAVQKEETNSVLAVRLRQQEFSENVVHGAAGRDDPSRKKYMQALHDKDELGLFSFMLYRFWRFSPSFLISP